jgi:hypothetical protein
LRRLGVLLSPRQADVFDVIARQSKYGGIRTDVLAGMFRGGEGCLKVHISNINKKLEATPWRIGCDRDGCKGKGFYRIKKRPKLAIVRIVNAA